MQRLTFIAIALFALTSCSGTKPIAPAAAPAPPPGPAAEVVDLSAHLRGMDGAFVLYDRNADRYVRHNPTRAAKRFSPCSTFKIPNSLIALDTGVASGAEFAIPWDREKDPPQPRWAELGLDWERDHTLASALRNSVVWFYQELARRIGAERMAAYLARFGYGNLNISDGIDRFWLTGSLAISADEQVGFLRRLYDERLGVSHDATEIVKRILVLERGDGYTLSAKTGSGAVEGAPMIGWLVGWVEAAGNVFFFAFNVSGTDAAAVRAARVDATKAILRDLGALPAGG